MHGLPIKLTGLILPGIELPGPQGGVFGYYVGALIAGALIGLVCTWPDNAWLGSILGGICGAVLVFVAPWQQSFISPSQTFGAVFLTLTMFLPLALILTPFAFLVRFSVDRLPSIRENSISIRKVALPVVATILAAWLGISSLYPQEVRDAMYITQGLIEKGLQASRASQLSEPLQPVEGFIPNANGRYILERSDVVESFMGPHPVTTRTDSDFLIVVRFKNGFSLACIFSPGVKQPTCANYN